MKEHLKTNILVMVVLILVLPLFPRQQDPETTIKPGEMKRILKGAGEYCEKVKKAAFHFFCYEKVSETGNPLKKPGNSPIVDEGILRGAGGRTMDSIRRKTYSKNKKYIYTNMLLQTDLTGVKVLEEITNHIELSKENILERMNLGPITDYKED